MKKTFAVLARALLGVGVGIAVCPTKSKAGASDSKELVTSSSSQPFVAFDATELSDKSQEDTPSSPLEDPCDLDSNWALKAIHLKTAHLRFKDRNQGPGQGVVMAHIDSGISPHPALLGAPIDLDDAFNFIDLSQNVVHRFSKFQFPKHGHGTETLSLIAAPQRRVEGSGTCISGVAPFARVIPLLATDSAIIGFGTRVARAVVYAVDKGAQVINISLGEPLTMHAIEGMMNDFRIIRNDKRNFAPMSARDVADRHARTLGYFRSVLAEQHDRKFVVVGHHTPSFQSAHEMYAHETLMNGGYHSDLSEFIMDHTQIKLWTHGHTHHPFDYVIGETRIVCNPRGYENDGYSEQTCWNPNIVLEV